MAPTKRVTGSSKGVIRPSGAVKAPSVFAIILAFVVVALAVVVFLSSGMFFGSTKGKTGSAKDVWRAGEKNSDKTKIYNIDFQSANHKVLYFTNTAIVFILIIFQI